jgi:hypothetical protein
MDLRGPEGRGLRRSRRDAADERGADKKSDAREPRR